MANLFPINSIESITPKENKTFELKGSYAIDFETMSVFKEFDQTYNTEIRYVVFETSMVDQVSELHEQIDRYILMLEEYVGEHVQQIKKELIQKQMEEHS